MNIIEFITSNWPYFMGLLVTIVTIYVTMKQTLKSVEKDVHEIKVEVASQRDKDAEHDVKFAKIQGEIEILKVEQKNLREYAIDGIQELKESIGKLREFLMQSK